MSKRDMGALHVRISSAGRKTIRINVVALPADQPEEPCVAETFTVPRDQLNVPGVADRILSASLEDLRPVDSSVVAIWNSTGGMIDALLLRPPVPELWIESLHGALERNIREIGIPPRHRKRHEFEVAF